MLIHTQPTASPRQVTHLRHAQFQGSRCQAREVVELTCGAGAYCGAGGSRLEVMMISLQKNKQTSSTPFPSFPGLLILARRLDLEKPHIETCWLVVSTPLKNMKVRWDHHPNYWGKKNVPNHQPDVIMGVIL